jgi:hypothetical protein
MKMGPTRCPETSVNNYHTTPCNYPKDHRLHSPVSMKPHTVHLATVCDVFIFSSLHSTVQKYSRVLFKSSEAN